VILYKYRIEIEIWISNRHYLLPVFFFRTVFFCFLTLVFYCVSVDITTSCSALIILQYLDAVPL